MAIFIFSTCHQYTGRLEVILRRPKQQIFQSVVVVYWGSYTKRCTYQFVSCSASSNVLLCFWSGENCLCFPYLYLLFPATFAPLYIQPCASNDRHPVSKIILQDISSQNDMPTININCSYTLVAKVLGELFASTHQEMVLAWQLGRLGRKLCVYCIDIL